MNILIRTIDHKKQRYPTVGDWEFIEPGPHLVIRVSDLGDPKLNTLIAIHELVEAILCKFNGPEITTQIVDEFDLSHPELEEPGESLNCPYMTQHLVASDVEKMIADRLKVDWNSYCEKVKSL
jgi:hypothetical protein